MGDVTMVSYALSLILKRTILMVSRQLLSKSHARFFLGFPEGIKHTANLSTYIMEK